MAMGPGFCSELVLLRAPRRGRMTSLTAFTVLVGLVGLERLAELVVSNRNAAWSTRAGRRRDRAGPLPVHGGAAHRAAGRRAGRGLDPTARRARRRWPGRCSLVVLLTQALRWWCIATLGRRWNTRVIVVPGLPPVTGGPYRFLTHPNYVAVVVEGIALPLVHACWITAARVHGAQRGAADGADPGRERRPGHPARRRPPVPEAATWSSPAAARSAWPPRCTPPAPASTSSSASPGPARSTRPAARG